MKKNNLKMNPVLAEKLAHYQAPEGHKKPMTRREFLNHGLLTGTTCFAVPSLLGLLGENAYAATDDGSPLKNAPAYLEINCAGGAGFIANLAMLSSTRGFLPSYTMCGQGSASAATSKIGALFNNQTPFFTNAGLYKGITKWVPASDPLFKQAVCIPFATSVVPDSGVNPMSAFGLVQSNIESGKFMPGLLTNASFNMPAYVSPPSPIIVSSVESVLDVVRPRSSDTISQFAQGTQTTLMKYLKQLNTNQLQRYANRPQGADLVKATTSAMDKVEGLLADRTINFDPRTDATFSAIWNTSWDANYTDLIDPVLKQILSPPDVAKRNLQESVIIYSLVKGYSNSGGIYRFGYDYHGLTRAVTDALDAEIGQLIGKILLSFKAFNRPVFIYVTTDGTVYGAASEQGGTDWIGDSGVNTVNFIIAYRPGTGVEVIQTSGKPETQIGYFTNNQISEPSHTVASARGSASAAFVNYLNFMGIDGVNSVRSQVTTLKPDLLRQLSVIKPA